MYKMAEEVKTYYPIYGFVSKLKKARSHNMIVSCGYTA